uniref:Uncharacterized protein n=1 Tax=Ciona intestinalis TaxID=7719 RepID=H2XNS2_CIOIN
MLFSLQTEFLNLSNSALIIFHQSTASFFSSTVSFALSTSLLT